jgi:hypothetical protein
MSALCRVRLWETFLALFIIKIQIFFAFSNIIPSPTRYKCFENDDLLTDDFKILFTCAIVNGTRKAKQLLRRGVVKI